MADVTYFIRAGNLYKHVENDGAVYLRRGPEAREYYMCTVEEAKTQYPEQLAKASGVLNALHEISTPL